MSGGRPPTLLPVLGWSMLGGALALLFSGLLGFKLIALARSPGALILPPGPGEGLDLKVLLRPVEPPLWVLSWAQVLLAPPAAVVSTRFLKRRAWARVGMEAMTWAGILLTAAFPLLLAPFTNQLFREALLLAPASPLPPSLRLASLSGALLVTLLLEIPLVLTLKALRSAAMRSACVL